jgi:hypothetical protein
MKRIFCLPESAMSTIPSRIAASLSIVAITLTAATHAQTDPPTDAPPRRIVLEPLQGVQFQSDSRVFQTFGEGSLTLRAQSERFFDPQQRPAVRAEQRAHILETHRDIGELLQLDATTESKLIELLTDHQMNYLERFYASVAARMPQSDPWDSLYVQAENTTAKVQALRELLGQEKLERYQAFSQLVNDYAQVARLDARLDAPHKLNIDQKRRLAELWQEQMRKEIEASRRTLSTRSPFGFSPGQELPSIEELQSQSELMGIARNEDNWRRMPKAHQWLRQRAAKFLTRQQLDALSQMNAEKADSLQKWIENARLQAGLSLQIPEEPETPAPPLPALLAGKVKVVVKLTINRNDANHFTHTGRNGKAVTFESAEGLLVEVRPEVYEDQTFDVRVFYYEADGRGGRRLIGEGGQMGKVTKGDSGGTGGNVITGNQAYAVLLSAQAESV